MCANRRTQHRTRTAATLALRENQEQLDVFLYIEHIDITKDTSQVAAEQQTSVSQHCSITTESIHASQRNVLGHIPGGALGKFGP
jgi:hypothetical protein